MIQSNIDLIKQLKEQLSQDSCLPKEPFIKLGEGRAPTLNYNIPQTASFTTYAPQFVKGLSGEMFQEHTKTPVKGNYFDTVKELDAAGLKARFAQAVQLQRTDDVVLDGGLVRRYMNVGKSNLQGASLSSSAAKEIINQTLKQADSRLVADTIPSPDSPPLIQDANALNEIQLANIAAEGLQPMVIERMGGFQTKMALLQRPGSIVPYFSIIEEYTTSAFLGDYGAGRTINTFSLLPAEKTTITVKTYKDSLVTKAYSENVLDSFSESSTDDLERNIENESGYTDSNTSGTGETNTTTRAANVSASVKGGFLKIFSFSASGGYQSGSSNSTTNSASATRAASVRSVNNALDKHVANSNANRQVQVNTSTTETVHEGEETSTVRELVNLNKSRVLNFVFRQLLQEYITITYLSNVRFAFCNGYKDSLQVVDLEELDKLLEDNVLPEHKEKVRTTLLKNYCDIVNYKDEAISFIEAKEYKIGACVGLSEIEKFWRINRKVSDSYLVNEVTGFSISVPGPILNVQKQTLKTSSVVVDALLGQGEALDCYGMKTQDAAAISEQLKNLALVQQMELVDAVADPIERAKAYKQIFGSCCDTPQTQII